jgi:hypothetical protein
MLSERSKPYTLFLLVLIVFFWRSNFLSPQHLRKHYGLNDQGCHFFTMHEVADWIVRLNIMKFDGLYDAYS